MSLDNHYLKVAFYKVTKVYLLTEVVENYFGKYIFLENHSKHYISSQSGNAYSNTCTCCR